MISHRVIATSVAALFFAAAALGAPDMLIRGAKVHTAATRGTLENADVLVRDGKIAAVGVGLVAAEGTIIVAGRNRPLTPGLYTGLANLGVVEVWGVEDTVQAGIGFGAPTWDQQWRPEFDAARVFNPRSLSIPVARIEGLTWTMLAPESSDSIMSGQGAAMTLDGRFDATLAGSRTLFVNWNGASAQSGGSGAGSYMLFEQAIREVRSKNASGRALLQPAGREALATYLHGGRVIFNVDRAADIRQLVMFAQRNGMRPVISGGAEAWLVADELARARVPVILNPLTNLPEGFNQLGARLDNATLLHRAGVRIAFSSGDVHNARKIRQLAGNAVAHGLPWEAALQAVTAAPAEIFGMGATRGSISVGQVADLVLWNADPLDVTSAAEQVWIEGRAIEMRSRQSDLLDRYLKRSP
jgi:hypothetical protein